LAPRPQAADTAGLDASPTYLARLGWAAGGTLPVEELARVFLQAVRQRSGFLPDVAAPATATAVGGSRSLLALALAPGAAGVPSGGAATGQRLQLRGPAGEVIMVRGAPTAGSHRRVVRGAPGLAGQPVLVVGLEHAAVPTIG